MKTKILIGAVIVLAALQAQPRNVWSGVFSKDQATRGKPLYEQNCGACHGPSLEGVEMAPALTGGDFQDKWIGQTLGDLFERIRTTMPQDKPGRLSREINTDILAYILSVNGYPAGETELPRDTQVLNQILITAKK
jgi:quinoprotein glucose dehydrogenase